MQDLKFQVLKLQVDRMINLIEVENGNRNDFNYYNIALTMKDGMELF